MIKIATASAFTCALFLAGCATTDVKFTNQIAVPTAQDLRYLNSNFELIKQGAETTLDRHFFMYVPLSGFYEFNDKTVITELLDEYDGDLVTNLRIDRKFLFTLYYNRYYVVAKGDIWKKKRI